MLPWKFYRILFYSPEYAQTVWLMPQRQISVSSYAFIFPQALCVALRFGQDPGFSLWIETFSLYSLTLLISCMHQ